jgi:hypothetical protein
MEKMSNPGTSFSLFPDTILVINFDDGICSVYHDINRPGHRHRQLPAISRAC